jgi:pyruvate formate lyase activating enzyme
MIQELMEKRLVDYVAMDVKTEPSLYPRFIRKDVNPEDIRSSIERIMAAGIAYEFRTTCVRPFVDAETVEAIGRLIQGCSLYVLQPFRRTRVLDPAFFENRTAGYDQEEMIGLKAVADPWVQKCIVR